jgi:hypothetical protein
VATPAYDPQLTLREGRQQYFDAFGLGAAGYKAKWVTLRKLGPIPVGFPNSAARVRAVKIHDLHHVLTGYAADWTGEAEIGAWEVGASCHRHAAAWVLNLLALQYGFFIAPRRVLAAMARGRRSETLYRMRDLCESLLDERVGDVRKRLRLDAPAPAPSFGDAIALTGWMIAGFALWAGPWALAAGILVAML